MKPSIECPHCYTQVVPMAHGACPSCLKNVNERIGTDANKTSVTIRQGEPLPSCCVGCGEETDRVKKILKVVDLQRSDRGANFLVTLVGILCGLFTGLLFWRSGGQRAIKLGVIMWLPLCSSCDKGKRVKPRHVDFQREEMTFVASNSFVERLEQIRRKRTSSRLSEW